jgi:ankyrin repeat protein
LGAAHALLARGGSPNARNRDGQTPLHQAARGLDAPLARSLLRCGGDANVPELRPSPGWTPLHCACARPDAVALLAALFASPTQTHVRVHLPDARGDTPLHLVCRLGGALAALRAGGGSACGEGSASTAGGGRQSRSLARSAPTAVRSGVSSGRSSKRPAAPAAEAAAAEGGGLSPSRRRGASQGRHGYGSGSPGGGLGSGSHGVPEPGSGVLRAVQLLLAHGANANAQNARGQTPLLLLAQNRFLRDAGAEAASALAAQATAQALSAANGLQRAGGAGALVLHACASALLAAHADPNATDWLGSPPLFAAVLAHDQPLAELLLASGAELNFPQPQLHFARAQFLAEAAFANAAALLLASGMGSGMGSGVVRLAEVAARTPVAADGPEPPPAPPPFAALPPAAATPPPVDAPAAAVDSFLGFFGLEAPKLVNMLPTGGEPPLLPPVLVYELVPNGGFLRAMLRVLVRTNQLLLSQNTHAPMRRTRLAHGELLGLCCLHRGVAIRGVACTYKVRRGHYFCVASLVAAFLFILSVFFLSFFLK